MNQGIFLPAGVLARQALLLRLLPPLLRFSPRLRCSNGRGSRYSNLSWLADAAPARPLIGRGEDLPANGSEGKHLVWKALGGALSHEIKSGGSFNRNAQPHQHCATAQYAPRKKSQLNCKIEHQWSWIFGLHNKWLVQKYDKLSQYKTFVKDRKSSDQIFPFIRFLSIKYICPKA